jgi:hypothetical protein
MGSVCACGRLSGNGVGRRTGLSGLGGDCGCVSEISIISEAAFRFLLPSIKFDEAVHASNICTLLSWSMRTFLEGGLVAGISASEMSEYMHVYMCFDVNICTSA